MAEGLEALLRSAQAALSAASATLPSAEERRAEAAAAESLAVSGAGAVAKTAVGVAGRLRRQWLRWLTEHGDAYEYDATVGPTVEHVLHFQTHGFKTRQNYSSLQLDGLGDTWGDLAVPYLLAKFVFTELKYPGWVGLKADELSAKRETCVRGSSRPGCVVFDYKVKDRQSISLSLDKTISKMIR
jgi:hypothetical protein